MGLESVTNGLRQACLALHVVLFSSVLFVGYSYSQENIFDSSRPTEIILVYDDSPSEFERSLSLVQQVMDLLSADENLKEEVNLKLIPYSFQYQRPHPSLMSLHGSKLEQKSSPSASMVAGKGNVEIYDGLRSLEILLKWEKHESLGLFAEPKNTLILFIGKTRFNLKPKIDNATGLIVNYQIDPYIQGLLADITDLLSSSENSKDYAVIFGETEPLDLIPVSELSLLAAAGAKENGFPDLRSFPRVIVRNPDDLTPLMKDLRGLMWDDSYLLNLRTAAVEKWEAEQQRQERLRAERERSQIEQQVESRFRLTGDSRASEPRDLSYGDQSYLLNTDLPIELVPLSRFDYVYRFYPSTINEPLRLEMRRENYYLDYDLISQLDHLDPSLLEKITGKDIHQVSVTLEKARAEADAEFFRGLFEHLGVNTVNTKPLEGTDAFTHLIEFPKGISLEQVRALLRDYVASPIRSESGRGLFDQSVVVDELLNRPIQVRSFVARDGDASRLTVNQWEAVLGIPKNKLHPSDMNLVYEVESVSTGLLGFGPSYHELVVHYSKPVLDVRIYNALIKKDPEWLRKRTDYSWAEIMQVFEKERMLGTQASPNDGELDFFVHLFESKSLKVIATQTSPQEGIFRIRFSSDTKKDEILRVMENYAIEHGYRDESGIIHTATEYVSLQRTQSDLRLRQSKMLSPEGRREVETRLGRGQEEIQSILELLKTKFSNCQLNLENQ